MTGTSGLRTVLKTGQLLVFKVKSSHEYLGPVLSAPTVLNEMHGKIAFGSIQLKTAPRLFGLKMCSSSMRLPRTFARPLLVRVSDACSE